MSQSRDSRSAASGAHSAALDSSALASDGLPSAKTPFLPRLYWMLLGPALMVVTAALIAKHTSWSLGWRDIVFWGAIGSLIGVRHLDVHRFGGKSADGTPVTGRDLRRHTMIIAAVGLLLWVLAHSVDV